ncbi:MAG: hypothetical protein WC775_02090 [Patescibacteria group bacterium]|jgi:hypothetical protein
MTNQIQNSKGVIASEVPLSGMKRGNLDMFVIPGIQIPGIQIQSSWIPAYAGMTSLVRE